MIAKSSLVCWSVCHFHEKFSRGETAHESTGKCESPAADRSTMGRHRLPHSPPGGLGSPAAVAVTDETSRPKHTDRDGKIAAPLTVTFYETGRSYGDVSANPRLERGPGSASYRRTVGSALKYEEKWRDFNPVSKYVSSTVNVRQACNIVWSKIKWYSRHTAGQKI